MNKLKFSPWFKNGLATITLFLLSFVSVSAQGGPVAQPVKLENPLKFDNFEDFLTAILEVIIILATPIVIFFIIYAGYLYVTARGNASQIEQATRALTYAIIGGVLIIGAVAIAEIVKNLVTSFTA